MRQQQTEARNRRGRLSQGFTLIEMLIVIVVISILAALLFPVFANVRASAYRSSCASNLKQLATAFTLYANDNNERLPGATDGAAGEKKLGGWMYYDTFGAAAVEAKFDVTRGSIYSYLRNAGVYVCPVDIIAKETGDSYAVNACVSKQTRDASGKRVYTGFSPGKKMSSFTNPTSWHLLSEESRTDGSGAQPKDISRSTDDAYINLATTASSPGPPPIQADPATPDYNNYFAQRHQEGANVAFLDGHVKWYLIPAIKEQKFQIGGRGDIALGCPP